MWLLLRILKFQEDYIIVEIPDYAEQYSKGRLLYCDERKFILEFSGINLSRSLLPKLFMESLRPRHKGEQDTPVNKRKINERTSLLGYAAELGYIERPESETRSLEVGTKELRASEGPAMRVSPKGDHFITYFGGLETLITTFPRVWGLLALPVGFATYKSVLSLIFKP